MMNILMPDAMVNATLETMQIEIEDAHMDDCDVLQRICFSWDNKYVMEGSPFEADYIKQCILHGDLPPISGASQENYRLKCFRRQDTGAIIGFSDMYFGYPQPEVVWISIFVIDKDYRGKGYAVEVLELLFQYCRERGFEKMALGVHLKNRRALRFWSKAGFDHIPGISGGKVCSDNTLAVIKLEKKLI